MRLVFVFALLSAPAAFAHLLPGEHVSRVTLLSAEERSLTPTPPVEQKLSSTAPEIFTLIGGVGSAVGVAMLVVGGLARSFSFLILGTAVLALFGLPLLIGLPWLIVVAVKNARIEREQQQHAPLVTLVSF